MRVRDYIPSSGWIQTWRRHFMVWRKTYTASLAGNLGEPLLYLAGMGYGLGRFVGEVGGMSYLVFVASGILASSSMNSSTFEVLYGAFTRMTRQNTYHAQLTTPLTVADVVAGEVVWAASKALIAGLAIFLVATLFGAFAVQDLFLTLPIVFLSGLTFASLGMVVTAVSPSYEFFLYYTTLVTVPMFLFCGVFYPVDSLPVLLQQGIQMLPLTHVVALMRPLATGGVVSDVLLHLGVISLYLVVGFVLAVKLVRRRIIV
ncbi:ABC-2 type transporter, NodJ family [Magnetococcus marinus MC-1]|uniref:Transport permease protein n=1 Tax=Magnetococcus marinus (strain ATCC BAA-1437 / JCM 17883 / MC-1) TaxID=156889 RepID=A0LCV1_MAGMM|nr:ABC transporter permease [Magnetococcus marinus]ABK45794.1 ABC-2 type transporter, NodJ family [Magnetococcus marinus MC-1]